MGPAFVLIGFAVVLGLSALRPGYAQSEEEENNGKALGHLKKLGDGVAPLGPKKFAGRVRAIVVRRDNPNIIWVAAASGGLWKSTNDGADWSQADDFLPSLTFSSLTIDPNNSNVMYAGSGELYPFLFHLKQDNKTLADIEGLTLRNPMRGNGIFKTADGGQTWTQLSFTANNRDFQYVNRIAVSPADSNIVLAGTNTGLWRSPDGGVKWIQENGVAGIVLDVKFHPLSLPQSALASTHSGGIYYSVSVGAQNNWFVSNLPADLPLPAGNQGTRIELAFSESEKGVWYAAYVIDRGDVCADGNSCAKIRLLSSTNSGATFVFADSKKDPITLDDSGTDFKNGFLYTGALWVDGNNPNNIVIGGNALVRRSRGVNGQINFTRIGAAGGDPAHSDFHVIVGRPNSRTIYVGNDGGVARIENYDSTAVPTTAVTTNLNTNLGNQQFHGAAKNPISGTVIGGTQDIGTLRRENTTGTWSVLGGSAADEAILGGGAGGDDAMRVATDPTDANFWYFGSSQGRVSRSDNDLSASRDNFRIFDCAVNQVVAADNCSSCSASPLLDSPVGKDDLALPLLDRKRGGNCLGYAPILIDPINPQTLYIGCARLWRTLNAKGNECSINWAPIGPQPAAGNQQIVSMAIARYDANIMCLGTLQTGAGLRPSQGGEVWLTTNLQAAGVPNWNRISSNPALPIRPVSGVAFPPVAPSAANPRRVFVGLSGWDPAGGSKNLWKGTEQPGGSFTWIDRSGGLPPGPVFSLTTHPTVDGWLYAGTHSGLYRSADDGQTWSAIIDGRLPRVPISDLSWVGNTAKLLVSTYGRGVFELDETSNPERVIPEVISYTNGQTSSGHIENLAVSDDRFLFSSPTAGGVTMEVVGRSGFSRTAPLVKGASLIFQLESSSIKPPSALKAPTLTIELFNFTTGTYQQVFSGAAPTTEQLISKSGVGSPGDFIGTSRELRARVTWVGISSSNVDFARWAISR